MLDEMPVEEKSPKAQKLSNFLTLLFLVLGAGLFFFLLYQALSNQIKF